MINRVNQRLLMIEFGSHLLGLQELARMLEPEWKLSFAIRHQNKAGSWRDEFTHFSRYSRSPMLHAEIPRVVYSVTKTRWLARLIGDSLFYGRVFFGTFFSRRVLITTGPEHGGRIEITAMWLVVFLRRGRVILNVRDGKEYMKALKFENRDAWSNMAASMFKRIKRFSFETEGVRNTFSGVLRSDSVTGVIPWMMSDMAVNQQEVSSPKPESTDAPILIGVLGTIDNNRRDYETVFRALRCLSSWERERLKLLFLAGPPPQTNISQFRRRISNLLEAEFPDEPGFLLSYIPRGSSCDVLLAPLREEAGYGSTKGSGAFGDLLAMRKKLIAPKTSDPLQEFSAFAHYYRDDSELARILKQIIADPFSMLAVDHTDYEQWSAPSVYRRNITLFS